jgi:hypothetical protein
VKNKHGEPSDRLDRIYFVVAILALTSLYALILCMTLHPPSQEEIEKLPQPPFGRERAEAVALAGVLSILALMLPVIFAFSTCGDEKKEGVRLEWRRRETKPPVGGDIDG